MLLKQVPDLNWIIMKLKETNLVIKYQFLLALNKKLVGFERHLYYAYQDKKKVDITEKGADRKKSKYVYEDNNIIAIVHKTPETLFLGCPHRYSRINADDKSIVSESYVNPVYGMHGLVFHSIKHNSKVRITDANIKKIAGAVRATMKYWRWDLVDTYWTFGEGMRQIHIVAANNRYFYNGGEYSSTWEIADIERMEKLTKEEYLKRGGKE